MDSCVSPTMSVDASHLGATKSLSESENHKFVVIGQKLLNSGQLRLALKNYEIPTIFSDTGLEHINDADAIFVIENFDGSSFNRLHQQECRIVGPAVVIQACDGILPYRPRPLYCTSMDQLTICFNKDTSRTELVNLANIAHYMGASIKKDMSSKVTHLVAWRSGGQKYKMALSMGIRIMTDEWVYAAWQRRDDVNFKASDPQFIAKYKWDPFRNCILSFYGFTKEEMKNFEELTNANGGQMVAVGSPSCTHLIVNDKKITSLEKIEFNAETYVVALSWFWASIQMEACADEMLYHFRCSSTDENNHSGSNYTLSSNFSATPRPRMGTLSKVATPLSNSSKSSKRRRLQENLAHLANEGEVNSGFIGSKVRNGDLALPIVVSNGGGVTINGGIKTENAHDNAVLQDLTFKDVQKSPQPIRPQTSLTPRQHTIMELLQTETNYVSILATILKVFKEEIERTDQAGGPILDLQESKNIFGGIPPICDIHLQIKAEISEIVSTWSDKLLIGDVFLKHAESFAKYYPPFVNYFEKTREMINKCDKAKPRFHAFLKLCQDKPECGRQTLFELMIRPVQRLPSVLLLLRDILKRTDKSHADHCKLEKAITAIEEVMTHINEDKRKTEGHQIMFEIMNSIDNCPPNLLSAHRSFIRQVNVMEVGDTLHKKGELLTLFVFTDSLEICKRRLKASNAKSPGVGKPQKLYKHLTLVSFLSIKRLVNITETNDIRHIFALIIKKIEDKEERLYAFSMNDPNISKVEFLTLLSKNICNAACRADYETLIASCDASMLNLDSSDMFGYNSLSRVANKFTKRVSRAFSLNKSPTNGMKRTISSMSQIAGSASAANGGYDNDYDYSSVGADSLGRSSMTSSIQSLASVTPMGSVASGLNENWNDYDTKSCYMDQTVIDANELQQRRRDTMATPPSSSSSSLLLSPENNKKTQQSVDNLSTLYATPRLVRHPPPPPTSTTSSSSSCIANKGKRLSSMLATAASSSSSSQKLSATPKVISSSNQSIKKETKKTSIGNNQRPVSLIAYDKKQVEYRV